MPLIARYDKSRYPWERTTGMYGHLPKFTRHVRSYSLDEHGEFVKGDEITFLRPRLTYVGYLVLHTRTKRFILWYMGNPYRHRIFEVQERRSLR